LGKQARFLEQLSAGGKRWQNWGGPLALAWEKGVEKREQIQILAALSPGGAEGLISREHVIEGGALGKREGRKIRNSACV